MECEEKSDLQTRLSRRGRLLKEAERRCSRRFEEDQWNRPAGRV